MCHKTLQLASYNKSLMCSLIILLYLNIKLKKDILQTINEINEINKNN